MSRQRYFTVDEALEQLLDEENEEIFGPSATTAESADDSDNDGVDADGALSGSGGTGEGDSVGAHYLDTEIDPAVAAQQFLSQGTWSSGGLGVGVGHCSGKCWQVLLQTRS